MLRRFHSITALVAGLVVSFLAITGAVLSLQPLVEKLATPSASGLTADLGSLAAAVARNFDTPTRLVKQASNQLIVYYQAANGPAASLVDPATGQDMGRFEPSAFFQFFTELHRSLLLGDGGRMVTFAAALAMAALTIGGAFLLVRRMGGWRRVFSSPKGTPSQWLHVEISRIGLILLVTLSLSGLWMSQTYFGWLGSDQAGETFNFPMSSEGNPMPVAKLDALKNTRLTDLRELVFPASGDPQDVFTLTTANGTGYVDQVTGEWIDFTPNSVWQDIYQTAYTLHTGQGIWWYALVMGFGALLVPGLGLTGLLIWWKRRAGQPQIRENALPQSADIIILVGSEGRSTWGFAIHLFEQLKHEGHSVHIAPMNALPKQYSSARTLLILAATYGNGHAPSSAKSFLERLEAFGALPGQAYAVLGFGDRSFPAFCAYAREVDAALEKKGLTRLLQMTSIDRQSAPHFNQWGEALNPALHTQLALNHQSALPTTTKWVLESRRDFGLEFQKPKSILRFRLATPERPTLFARIFGRGPHFQAGDLVGILPPEVHGGTRPSPRYYSLASSVMDGFLEICVSKQPGGLCSTYLHDLQPGECIEGFIKPNPDFRQPTGKAPVIMIGAGTGVAPFIGMLRGNRKAIPTYLYWGGRDPLSDFLFREELETFRKDGRLEGAMLAFSRVGKRQHVQDRLRTDALFLRQTIGKGAKVMVCGSFAMSRGVGETLDEILAPINLDIGALRQSGRYLEDVY